MLASSRCSVPFPKPVERTADKEKQDEACNLRSRAKAADNPEIQSAAAEM